jgi:hypothetical protein
MKSQYEKEIYQYFTQPENFETMVSVVSHSEKVFDTLIRDFWDDLKHALEAAFQKKPEDWVVEYSGKFESRYCKLWAYREAWVRIDNYPLVSVAFEDFHYGEYPFLGIHLNIDQNLYDPVFLKKEIKALPNLPLDDSNNSYWVGRRYFPFNLTQHKNLVKILPAHSNTTIDNLVAEALTIADFLDPVIDDIIQKSKVN